jgi:hypothetical protein
MEIKWYHFWNPQSGLAGGMISGAALFFEIWGIFSFVLFLLG